MRRPISALLIACLLTVGYASASVAQDEEPQDTNAAGSLTLEVAELVGMEGLELAGAVWDGPVDVFHVPIALADFAASERVPLDPGHHYVWVFAGEPPCEPGVIPTCGPDREPATYFCWFDLDVLPGDHLVIGLAGLPAFSLEPDSGTYGCPVRKMIHLADVPDDAREQS